MSTHLTWMDIAVRLALTLVVGIVIGFNRSEHGKAAGMRTTLLVCLAASVAMIQMNVLLPTSGRSSDSFIMNDLMRLPLGILTGVGFIGGGAILRRDNIVVGVTTAATLWVVTVIGLCLGGGQIGLGLSAAALSLLALRVLPPFESRMHRLYCATVRIELGPDGPSEAEIAQDLTQCGVTILGIQRIAYREGQPCELEFLVRELRRPGAPGGHAALGRLAARSGVQTLAWEDEA
jgi:putative Mg2+ transporter-C (MgtC) family protein